MLWQRQVYRFSGYRAEAQVSPCRLSCRQKSFSARGHAPDGGLAIFEVIAEGLPPDKLQDYLINQLIQIEDERDRLDQSELIAMVALLIVVC